MIEDTMHRASPPFRADHVGSLLRPKSLHEASEKHAEGKIDANDLKTIEDGEIERVIKDTKRSV
jgi:5-methyltetrahydropteroyltriglutamate--homocysteine methyltransferase